MSAGRSAERSCSVVRAPRPQAPKRPFVLLSGLKRGAIRRYVIACCGHLCDNAVHSCKVLRRTDEPFFTSADWRSSRIVVGIAGTLIALPFFEFFSRLGAWGRLVGFRLAVPYFVLLNSRIGKGQTLGKRAMHLQVVTMPMASRFRCRSR